MIELTYKIQDVYGHEYEAAVVVVQNVNQRFSSELNINSQANQEDEEQMNINSSVSIGFSAQIFKDLDSKNKGLRPMQLKNLEGQEWFNFMPSEPFADAEALKVGCEAYLLDEILPKLKF